MKKTFIITLSLFISFSITLDAQYTFQTTISNPDDQIINCVTEDDDGNFILVGRKYSKELDLTQAYLIRLAPSGELMDEMVFDTSQESRTSMFFNVFFFNDNLFLLGSKRIDAETTKLLYLKLDKNLIIVNEKLLDIPASRWFSYMNSIIDSDSNFVITGYTTRLDTNQNRDTNYNNDAFFYKLSLNGDSLTSHFYTSWVPIHFSFDLIESQDSSKYYAFVSHFTEVFGTSGQRLTLNKNLDSLNIDSIPLRVYDFYSPIYLNQGEILICGKSGAFPPNDYALNVLTITETGSLIDYGTFKKNPFRDHPSMFQGVSKYDNNIYVGGTSNFDYYNPFFSTLDSWFHLIKINPDITPIWENWYGGDAYYFLYSILATSDSGCLMVGNRYDYETQDMERDIYVAKVDSEGLIVWTQEIQPDKHMFTIYPNPGNETLNVNLPLDQLEFQLFDLTGRMEFEAELSSGTNSITVSSLPAGIYLYRIYDRNQRMIQSGKWIKM
ncbi:MAG: T9SS type A sorting domain-containing protein [Bacteroidales bacterium]|nr:T9SS type A sorting domain-containing protein [Bacteroidales bacterium]